MQDWNTYENQGFFINAGGPEDSMDLEWKRDGLGSTSDDEIDGVNVTANEDLQDDFQREIDRLFCESIAELQQNHPSMMSLPLEQVDQLHYQNMAEMQQDCPSLMLSAQEQGLGLLPFSEPGFSDASSYSSDHWKHNPPIEKDLPSSPEKVLSNLCLHNVDQKEASPAKPGLRLHIPKQWQHSRNTKVAPDTAQINPHLYESSMKPRVDAKTLRRLTLAVLRSLCIPVDINEIPIIDCENPSLDDVHLPVPATAMRLMTVMVLGTSGDKRVCETIGSQISNGDLIALQRTITATMHTKNIINRPLITTAATDAYRNGRSAMHEKNMDGIYDLSFVQFKPVATVTPLFFRLYRFIIDTLVSTPECWRFMNSIPLATPAYHDKESHPMDLSTVELNAWHGKYTTFVQFEQDLQLVWNNAADFHQNMCPIPKNERCLEDLFYDIVNTLKQPIWSQGVYMPEKHAFDPTRQIPEEIDHPDLSVDELFFKNKMVYIIPSVASDEQNVLQGRGLGDSRSSAIQLNRPFFQAVERMKANLTNTCTPIPRFYIASSGAFSKESLETAVYVILYNIRVTQTEEKHFVAETDVVLAIQACEIHDVENIKNDPKDPRLYGWMHMKPLRAMERIVFRINESIQRDYFHKTFAPFKVVYVSEEDESGLSSTERYLKHMVQIVFNISDGKGKRETFVDGISHKYGVTRAGGSGTADVTDRRNKNIQPTDQEVQAAANIQFGVKCIKNVNGSNETPEIMYDVWQKLLNKCYSKGIGVHNISQRYRDINWKVSHSEGFFKQVYFSGNVVVQTFRNMTTHQRVTEIACLMKLRNLPHMAQILEVLYNDQGDIVGLSMERYQATLKEYGRPHPHYRLTAYQKYDIIYQMLKCMKTIHAAGLAHRDLSEVNFMVNTIDGELEDQSSKICLYLIDFGKSIFCNPQDVRDWFVEAPHGKEVEATDDDVAPKYAEELHLWCANLPWIKGKPDHGYRMYRSIQTLPKTRTDNQILPWLIQPQSEDMYSAVVMMWKIFSETEPWRGILDSDIQGLRYVAEDDYRIQKAIESEVHGELSRALLFKCLRAQPQDRETAASVLEWITRDDIKDGLLTEWKMYSSETRASRRAKPLHRREDELKEKPKQRRKTQQSAPGARKMQQSGSGRNRSRPKPKS